MTILPRHPRVRASPRHRALTVMEMLVVTTVIGIVAVTAIPAVSAARDAYRVGAAAELERHLLTARAEALATGRPRGVRVDRVTTRIEHLVIASAGATPTPATDALGSPRGGVLLADSMRGVAITAMTDGAGAASSLMTVWFANDGTPQRRGADGSLQGPAAAQASVEFPGNHGVRVTPVSGAVERW
ncbi:MAG TPA: hypothetical protein VD971_10605 [Phycisphaerales bacterium]|nr:hypothetical protein [Phycisphaerales bacterium]